jgi:hypothetical protein
VWGQTTSLINIQCLVIIALNSKIWKPILYTKSKKYFLRCDMKFSVKVTKDLKVLNIAITLNSLPWTVWPLWRSKGQHSLFMTRFSMMYKHLHIKYYFHEIGTKTFFNYLNKVILNFEMKRILWFHYFCCYRFS